MHDGEFVLRSVEQYIANAYTGHGNYHGIGVG